MDADPMARITAALAALRADYVLQNIRYGTMALLHQANQGLLLAKAVEDELPALIARLAALEIVARRVTPTFLCEDEVEEIAALRTADTDIQCLAGYIRDQDIEIDRSHEREAAQGARLAAAEAVIAAVREAVPASEWHDEDGPILAYEDTRPLWRALAAYDALVGTGEG